MQPSLFKSELMDQTTVEHKISFEQLEIEEDFIELEQTEKQKIHSKVEHVILGFWRYSKITK